MNDPSKTRAENSSGKDVSKAKRPATKDSGRIAGGRAKLFVVGPWGALNHESRLNAYLKQRTFSPPHQRQTPITPPLPDQGPSSPTPRLLSNPHHQRIRSTQSRRAQSNHGLIRIRRLPALPARLHGLLRRPELHRTSLPASLFPSPLKIKGKLNICPALPRPWLPQLRGVPPPRRLPGPDRGLHVPGLRGRHHPRRPEQVLGRQVAAPRQLPARRVRDQGVGPAAG